MQRWMLSPDWLSRVAALTNTVHQQRMIVLAWISIKSINSKKRFVASLVFLYVPPPGGRWINHHMQYYNINVDVDVDVECWGVKGVCQTSKKEWNCLLNHQCCMNFWLDVCTGLLWLKIFASSICVLDRLAPIVGLIQNLSYYYIFTSYIT